MNKRKTLVPQKELDTASVDFIHIEDMVLKVKDKALVFYFNRLRYKNVPNVTNKGGGDFRNSMSLVNMNRDSFVRWLFHLVKDEFTTTMFNYLKRIALYVRFLDENDFLPINGDYFHKTLTHNYINELNKIAKTGVDASKASVARKSISYVLKKTGRKLEAEGLPKAYQKKSDIRGYDLEFEIKPITKLLFIAFRESRKHFFAGTHPDAHPLYDKTKLESYAASQGWTSYQLSKRIDAFILSMNPLGNLGITIGASEDRRRLCNHLTRIAIMICFMLTGINTEPMLLMRRKDVRFKQAHGDRYLFDTIKSRAGYQENDNGIGFTKRTKEFVEQWLDISKFISGSSGDDAWLFPFIDKDNQVKNFVATRAQLYEPFNKLLKHYGLPNLSAQRFRQTKSDSLMKVTESVFLVSMSLNNQMSTVSVNYSSGQLQDHERNLAATMNATMLLAKGNSIENSVSESKYKFKDILSEYDYKNRLGSASLTPSGVRCKGDMNLANQIERQLKTLKIKIPKEEKKCTNFLECFMCDNHVLVAMVDDIWLMMSFYDVIKSLKEQVAINSLPKSKLYELENTVKGILARFSNESVENFKKAKIKHSESAHPLYSDVRSISDLLEVFG